jgi:hypothetical protein
MFWAKNTNGEVKLKLQTTCLDIKLRSVLKFTFRPLLLPRIEPQCQNIGDSVRIIACLEVVKTRKILGHSRNNKLVFRHIFYLDIPPVFGAQVRAGNWEIFQTCFIKLRNKY